MTFVAVPGVDATRALRAVLKIALRRFGLRCADIKSADLVPIPGTEAAP